MIVVDSCCDLPAAMVRQGVFCSVPLTIRVGGRTFTDDAGLDQAELLAQMKHSKTAPATACPSPAQYLDAMECGADEIYVVTLSALLSGSHNAAMQARSIFLEEHPDKRVHVFNSCSASAGEVLVAMEVHALAASGLPFDRLVEQADRYIKDMNTLFVLDDLDNLRKNGRLTALQSVVTGALKIKLLMGSTPEGEICKRGQALSIKQALSKMAAMMAADPAHAHRTLCIAHCNCLDRAFYLESLVHDHCHFGQILLCDTGGISTVYANNGGIVAAY